MGRPRRMMPGGYVYHVLNRGNERHILFHDDEDFWAFLRLLGQGPRRFGVRICGYDLMRNHWHLLVWPRADGAVSSYLHWVTTLHSLHYRRHHGGVGEGHVYQGRFRSFPVQTEGYYFKALRYIEANALRAGVVSRAEDWRWSSLYERVNRRLMIDDGPLALPSDWARIVNQVQQPQEVDAIRACLGKGRPYGADTWMVRTAAAQALDQTLRGPGRSGGGDARRK